MSTLARNPVELPRFVFAALAQQKVHDVDAIVDSLVGQIARTAGGDAGYLFDVSKDSLTAQPIGRWARDGLRLGCDLHLCPWLFGQVLKGETVMLPRGPEGMPREAREDAEHLAAQNTKALLLVPALAGDRFLVAAIQNVTDTASWSPDVLEMIRFAAEILAAALESQQVQEELRRARTDLAQLAQQLESQNRVMKDDMQTVHDFDDIVGGSPVFQSALAALREVAATDTTTLFLGETGTGKELFARTLHERSTRRHKPFVAVNCAALPASLIESELFGHERGAFTGAITSRQGRFETADRGTIFLDEVGDLPMELQPKLLRVLQEREFERVGSSARRKVDVRVIAATHHDLEKLVAEGRFRADLYYRLSVFPIKLPPLRERPEDIPQLVWFLINQRQRRLHRRITAITADTMEALQNYHWPGNVRELENVLERAMIRSPEGTLCIDDSLATSAPRPVVVSNGNGTLEALERSHIEATLRSCRGRINGEGNAAERLGLHPNTLRFRIKKLGIDRRVAV